MPGTQEKKKKKDHKKLLEKEYKTNNKKTPPANTINITSTKTVYLPSIVEMRIENNQAIEFKNKENGYSFIIKEKKPSVFEQYEKDKKEFKVSGIKEMVTGIFSLLILIYFFYGFEFVKILSIL